MTAKVSSVPISMVRSWGENLKSPRTPPTTNNRAIIEQHFIFISSPVYYFKTGRLQIGIPLQEDKKKKLLKKFYFRKATDSPEARGYRNYRKKKKAWTWHAKESQLSKHQSGKSC